MPNMTLPWPPPQRRSMCATPLKMFDFSTDAREGAPWLAVDGEALRRHLGRYVATRQSPRQSSLGPSLVSMIGAGTGASTRRLAAQRADRDWIDGRGETEGHVAMRGRATGTRASAAANRNGRYDERLMARRRRGPGRCN